MSSAKEPITFLCQVLHVFGIDSIAPEHFRIAKRGDAVAREPFLRALHDLLLLESSSFSSGLGTDELDAIWKVSAQQSNGSDRVVAFVVTRLRSLGYPAYIKMQGGAFGARDVLIAFSWLVRRTALFQRYRERIGNIDAPRPLDASNTDAGRAYAHACAMRVGEQWASTLQGDSTRSNNLHRDVLRAKQMSLLYGQIHMALRRIALRQAELARLSHALHVTQAREVTTPSTAEGFADNSESLPTAFEIAISQGSDKVFRPYASRLESQLARVEGAASADRREHLFWAWAESVVTQQASEDAQAPRPSISRRAVKDVVASAPEVTPAQIAQHLTMAHTRLKESIEERRAAMDAVQELWAQERGIIGPPKGASVSDAVAQFERRTARLAELYEVVWPVCAALTPSDNVPLREVAKAPVTAAIRQEASIPIIWTGQVPKRAADAPTSLQEDVARLTPVLSEANDALSVHRTLHREQLADIGATLTGPPPKFMTIVNL